MKKGNEQRKRITVMSIMTYYARQIFDETKPYEFRKSCLRPENLNEKIYIYSAKDDKAIIGYVKVDEMLQGNTAQIMKATGYDKRPDGHEIVQYYGPNFNRCVALHLYDVTEFNEYLPLSTMRSVKPDVRFPQYYGYVYEGDPLYSIIQEWDKAFSLDGSKKTNPQYVHQMIKDKKRR